MHCDELLLTTTSQSSSTSISNFLPQLFFFLQFGGGKLWIQFLIELFPSLNAGWKGKVFNSTGDPVKKGAGVGSKMLWPQYFWVTTVIVVVEKSSFLPNHWWCYPQTQGSTRALEVWEHVRGLVPILGEPSSAVQPCWSFLVSVLASQVTCQRLHLEHQQLLGLP